MKPFITKGIFEVGSNPSIKYVHSREKICVFGALSESYVNSQMAEKLDNTTYLPFLKSLLRKCGKAVIVIDGARYHFEKSKVQKFYEENKHRLKVIQLPPYGPELNPIEQLWKKIKQWLATRVWYSKEELEKQLVGALNNPEFMVKIYDYLVR